MLRRIALGAGFTAGFTALVVACGGGTTSSSGTGTQSGALGTYRDGCDEAACGAQPAPKHQCVGGYPASVCTKARGACGWQVDCVAQPPPGYDGTIGVGACGDATKGEQCGAQPSWDDKDCVYGFINQAQCENYGGAGCAWSRRCAPQPCEQKGTCNTLDRSKLGPSCADLDAAPSCPDGYSCASITVNIGEYVPPVCIPNGVCPLTCATPGDACFTLESYPGQMGCGH